MTDPKVIDELERLLGEATPGPWQERIVTHESTTFRHEVRAVEVQTRDDHRLILTGPTCEEPGTENQRLVVALRNSAASLLADARALRELVAALPKCDAQSCNLVALHEESGGMCDDFNIRYWCDEHAEGHDVVDADWAPILREVKP